MKMIKKGKVIGIALVLIILALLYFLTGFFERGDIDKRDIEAWEYDEDGVIVGAREFILSSKDGSSPRASSRHDPAGPGEPNGDNETCWYLIHGYTSTPNEMRELAGRINEEFGEKVVATRLNGMGEVPSHIVDLTLDDWYVQVLGEFDELDGECGKVNLVGFSFGGALSARIAEERDVGSVYLLSPYLFATYKYYNVFRLEHYLYVFSDVLGYTKKSKIGQINSKEGLSNHIAYWNMPLTPIKYSASFFEDVKSDIGEIDSPILLQQSENDETSDLKSSIYIYDNVGSGKKELIVFKESNHILLADYDKEEVIQNIINFEREIRDEEK